MIINADDFGYSKNVNEAITEAFSCGVINRTTIMVNMPDAEEASKMARENGFFDKVGLHINLTEGMALSDECAKSPLCDENGRFKGTFHISFKNRFYLNKKIRKAISAEVEAQIKKYIDMGFTLYHADSHNYTHTYLSVYLPIRKLLKKYNFKSVRISRNIPENDFSFLFKQYKNIFNFLIKRLGLNTTKYFGSVQDFEMCGDKFEVKSDVELMTHPILRDGMLWDNTLPKPHKFITDEWIRENELYIEDVSGKKIKLFIGFIHVHIGGAMTSLINFLNAIDTDKYEVDVMFYENDGNRCGIKKEINILPQGKIHSALSISNVLKKTLSPPYVFAKLQDVYYKKIKHNKRRATQIMSKQGCKFSRKIDKEYDVAIAYEFNWPMNYVMTHIKAKKKILWHHVEYEKSGMDFKTDKKALNMADALVFVSEECLKSYCMKHPEHKSKSYFMPNLLSSEYVRQKDNEDITLPFYENTPIKLLTVARISFEHKGLDRAVNAFKRLRDDGLLKNVKWLIIGDGRDFDALCEMIDAADLCDVIYPIGKKTNPIPYMSKCDVLLLPSRHEGKPMVVTEGYIMGLVPVVTRYTSADEQIKDKTDGLVFDNNDEALYQGLKALLEKPEIIAELKKTVLASDYGNEKEIVLFDDIIREII